MPEGQNRRKVRLPRGLAGLLGSWGQTLWGVEYLDAESPQGAPPTGVGRFSGELGAGFVGS